MQTPLEALQEEALSYVQDMEHQTDAMGDTMLEVKDSLNAAIASATALLDEAMDNAVYELDKAHDNIRAAIPCRAGIEEFVENLYNTGTRDALHEAEGLALDGNYRGAFEALAAAVRAGYATPAQELIAFRSSK